MTERTAVPAGTLFTIGHSTRPIDEFVALLAAHGIERLVDVRRFPGSRRHPQFGQDALAAALESAGIGYTHEVELGGRREAAAADSPNRAWRNASFRAYADHPSSPEFQAALRRVLTAATERPTTVMCAEAVPWRCHRSLIADALLVHGLRVEEIVNASRRQAHTLTPFAKVDGLMITYPPES